VTSSWFFLSTLYEKVNVQLITFLVLVTDKGMWSASRSCLFISDLKKETPVRTEQAVGWPQQPVWDIRRKPVWDIRRKEKAEMKVSIFVASLKCLVIILKSGQ